MLNKLTEYLKLVPKGVKNSENIIKGIINNVKFNNGNLTEEEQEEIIKRRIICSNCPFNSTNAPISEEYKDLYNGQKYETERIDLHCAICACNIHWKTAVMDEQCGLQYYNDVNPNRKQELKWKKFEPNAEQTTTNE